MARQLMARRLMARRLMTRRLMARRLMTRRLMARRLMLRRLMVRRLMARRLMARRLMVRRLMVRRLMVRRLMARRLMAFRRNLPLQPPVWQRQRQPDHNTADTAPAAPLPQRQFRSHLSRCGNRHGGGSPTDDSRIFFIWQQYKACGALFFNQRAEKRGRLFRSA